MKHTPGPWRINKATVHTRSENPYTIESANGKKCIVWGMRHKANARLIAAAPDLLEACQYVIEQLKTVPGKTFPILPVLNAIKRATE